MLFLFTQIKETEGVNYLTWQLGIYRGDYEIRTEYLKPFCVALISVVLFGANLLWSLTTTKPVHNSPPPIPR